MRLPKRFLEAIFYGRKEFLKKALSEELSNLDIIFETLRHNPTLVTYGSAGLNASVKGVGFVVKEEFLDETISKLKEYAKSAKNPKDRIRILLELIYDDERIDFSKLITLDLARKHTWENVKNGSKITLSYIIPPRLSFEIRCDVEVHTSGPYCEYANILHDFYHSPEEIGKRFFPAYLMTIKEIYDNSVDSFGRRVFP